MGFVTLPNGINVHTSWLGVDPLVSTEAIKGEMISEIMYITENKTYLNGKQATVTISYTTYK